MKLQLNNLSHPTIQAKIAQAINKVVGATKRTGCPSTFSVRNNSNQVIFIAAYDKINGIRFINNFRLDGLVNTTTELVKKSILLYSDDNHFKIAIDKAA